MSELQIFDVLFEHANHLDRVIGKSGRLSIELALQSPPRLDVPGDESPDDPLREVREPTSQAWLSNQYGGSERQPMTMEKIGSKRGRIDCGAWCFDLVGQWSGRWRVDRLQG